jgi:hypothetical protein
MLGHSKSLLRVLDAAAHVAATDANILILGETGTGKELLAKAIHFSSGRRDQPFVVVNCSAIPKELLESELFGHVRGAFTGAIAHKKGKIEMADGGTVFLDEIGEMPLELQVRMLRLVQEREIEKVGLAQQIKVDVRIIAATNRNLEECVKRGKFREDLYYQLAVVPLIFPPLRERKEDIPELAQHFFAINKLSKRHRPVGWITRQWRSLPATRLRTLPNAPAPSTFARNQGLPDYKPVSVPSVAGERQPFLWAANYSAAQATYPGLVAERAAPRPLFGLAPHGVFPANRITTAAVRSYRTISPLPRPLPLSPATLRYWISRKQLGRYIFCGTFRKTRFERVPPAVSRHAALWRPDFPLPGRERLPVQQAHL